MEKLTSITVPNSVDTIGEGILAYTDHATVRCNKNSKIAEYCSVNEIAVSIID